MSLTPEQEATEVLAEALMAGYGDSYESAVTRAGTLLACLSGAGLRVAGGGQGLTEEERRCVGRQRWHGAHKAESCQPIRDLLAIIDRLAAPADGTGGDEDPPRCRHAIYHATCDSCNARDPEYPDA